MAGQCADNNGCQLELTGIFSTSRLTSWTSAKVKLEFFFIAQTDWLCMINNCIWCVYTAGQNDIKINTNKVVVVYCVTLPASLV